MPKVCSSENFLWAVAVASKIILRANNILIYCIVLSLYQCIDTKSNCIDISCIVIYRCIVACSN